MKTGRRRREGWRVAVTHQDPHCIVERRESRSCGRKVKPSSSRSWSCRDRLEGREGSQTRPQPFPT